MFDALAVIDRARAILGMLPRVWGHVRTAEEADHLDRVLASIRCKLESVAEHQGGTRALIAQLDQAISTVEVVRLMCVPIPAPCLL